MQILMDDKVGVINVLLNLSLRPKLNTTYTLTLILNTPTIQLKLELLDMP